MEDLQCKRNKRKRKKKKKKKKQKETKKKKGHAVFVTFSENLQEASKIDAEEDTGDRSGGHRHHLQNGVRSGDHRDSWLRSDTAKAIMGSWPAYFRDTADEDESSSDSNEEEDQVVGRIDVPSRATTRSSNFSVITSRGFLCE